MKTISTIVLTVATLLALVACSKKNDGGSSSPAPVATTCVPGQVVPVGYICQNGILVNMATQGYQNLATNIYMQSASLEGLLMIAGTQAAVAQPNPYGGTYGNVPSIETYQGQIQISGTIQVLSQTLCGAPLGGYSVSGTGMLMGGQIGQTTLTISGPVMMQLQIGSAVIYQGNRLGILMSQLTVNGVPCGAITTY